MLTPAAVAILFLAGLRSWSHAEGSWMLLTGGLLATVAVAFGTLVTLALTATDDQDILNDLRVQWLWSDITQTFGLLSVGFFFVAYRGLAPDTRSGPRTRLRRSEATPPSLPRHSGALVCALHAFAPCG